MNKAMARIKGVGGIVSRREQLLRDPDARSLKSGSGRLAILVSGADSDRIRLAPDKQIAYFEEHAETYAELEHPKHQEVLIVHGAGSAAILGHLQDPETTDIATFGHGCIEAVGVLDTIACNSSMVSRKATHLKLGSWLQATCGEFLHGYSVPLGAPALSDLSKLRAAPGVSIDLGNPQKTELPQIFNATDGFATQLASLNAKYYIPDAERAVRLHQPGVYL